MKQWLNKNLIGFSLASFFNDFCYEMATAILPEFVNLITGAGAAPLALGIIQGVSDAASTIMKLVSGWLSDRAAYYKPYLIFGYGLTGIFIALIGTAQSIIIILIYKTIAWMARGLREPMRDTWLSKTVDPQYYGHAFGFERAADTLGALIGPICAFIMLQLGYSLQTIFFVAIIPGILSMLPIIVFTKETKEQAKKESVNFWGQVKHLPPEFNFFIAIMFLFGIANFNQALLIYRAQSVLSGQATSSVVATTWAILLYACFNVIRGISEFGIGSLSDYVNRKNLLAIFGFGFFGITGLGFMINSTQLTVWFLFFAIAGISAGTVKALEKAHAATLLPENVRGTGMGVLQTCDGIGDLISSLIVGGLWTFAGPNVGFIYAAVLSFISMLILLIKK